MTSFLISTIVYFFYVITFLMIGWLLYDKVMIRNVNLSDSLFTDDNPVAGLEFAGILLAFFFIIISMIGTDQPVTVSKAQNVNITQVKGNLTENNEVKIDEKVKNENTLSKKDTVKKENILNDLYKITVELIFGILIFIIGRMLFNLIINKFNPYKNIEDVNLNNEIYKQKNWAASLASLAVIGTLANAVTRIDFFGEIKWWQSLVELLVVILGTFIIVCSFYFIRYLGKAKLYKQLFIDNNPAIGISIFSFVISMNILLNMALSSIETYEFLSIRSSIIMSLVVFIGVVAGLALISKLMEIFLKKSFYLEIFEDKNCGAAFIQGAIAIGITISMARIVF